MGCDEHVVSLDESADEKAGEWEDGETEAFSEILVDEGI